jgi:hypothetical protein
MSQLAQFILSQLSWQQNPSLTSTVNAMHSLLDATLHRQVLFWVGEKYAQLLAASKSFWSVHQDFQKFRTWFVKFALMPAPARYGGRERRISLNIGVSFFLFFLLLFLLFFFSFSFFFF